MRDYQVQGNLFVQESRLCEFLLVIHPPEVIRKQVQVYKEEFEQLFGSFNSRYTPPTVSVCDFLVFEHRTYDVFSLFRKRLEALYTPELRISGFNAFDATRSIQLDLVANEDYRSLLNELDTTRRMMHLRKNYFQRNEPYLTVARNIPEDVYPEAAAAFLPRNFQASFEVQELEVLKFDLISRKYRHYGLLKLNGRR